ncbi:MAG TPA: ATP-dependent zinc metalloprotease FtsH [Gaiellaceae bacterium]|nr:ATP-dependent zinc metalloprotease FtsH [Gaiellaceae bacterium]
MPDGDPTPSRQEHRRWREAFGWRLIAFMLVLFALNYWAATRVTQGPERVRVPYSPFFLGQVQQGNVESITSKGSAVQGEFAKAVRYPTSDAKAKPTTLFATEIPAFADTTALSKLLQRKGVVINAQPLATGTPWWENLIFGFLPTVLFIGLLVWLMRRAAGGAGGLMSFGRSRARRVEGAETGVTFRDVAGIDEAKAELAEIVDFLKNPDKYRRLGGRIPRGVLLSGPPGTGKTLLARAVAGEAGVPFFSMSASEFIEMIVGVGASRVRDLFDQAKQAAPAIVFIDELDAIGRSRGPGIGGIGGGHDEREQTLNQILTEMDGFDSSTGVIVLAATNRPDVLDPALLRPGRFDRRVSVQPPDITGRRLILEVHTRGVPLARDVDLQALAATTPGMVGADLANLANEAALLAARRDHAAVAMADFTDALEKIVLGAERKIMLSPADRERTAYHEAGHALAGMLTPGADPVRKVSIIPRGTALGVTFAAPESDRFSYQERELRAKLEVALAGRAAEQLVYGDLSTGAENDIRQVTELARQMAGRFGMSRAIGPVALLPLDARTPSFGGGDELSEETRTLFDSEVQRLVEDAATAVQDLLELHRDQLRLLAEALLERETLDAPDAYAAAGLPGGRGGRDERVEAPSGRVA